MLVSKERLVMGFHGRTNICDLCEDSSSLERTPRWLTAESVAHFQLKGRFSGSFCFHVWIVCQEETSDVVQQKASPNAWREEDLRKCPQKAVVRVVLALAGGSWICCPFPSWSKATHSQQIVRKGNILQLRSSEKMTLWNKVTGSKISLSENITLWISLVEVKWNHEKG